MQFVWYLPTNPQLRLYFLPTPSPPPPPRTKIVRLFSSGLPPIVLNQCRGPGFSLLHQPAFLPSAISSLFTQNKGRPWDPRAPPLDPPLPHYNSHHNERLFPIRQKVLFGIHHGGDMSKFCGSLVPPVIYKSSTIVHFQYLFRRF